MPNPFGSGKEAFQMKRAWLITWEWCGDHAKKADRIASILNYRISGPKVREYVERMYVNSEYSLSERLAYAKSAKNNPVFFFKLCWIGVIEVDSHGEQHLKWDEIPYPKFPNAETVK